MTLKEAIKSLDAVFREELENLGKVARSDDKTPLQNALAFSEAEENFAASDESPNVIVFADIDKFKNVNSRFGQIVGDSAIEEVGKLIKTSFVDNFQTEAFRIGGDEFILLFNQSHLTQFKSHTALFEKCTIPYFDSDTAEEKPFTVKVSFGIVLNDANCDFQTLRNRAEMACKKAKTSTEQRFFEWTAELERIQTIDFRGTCPKCQTIISCDVPNNKEVNLENLRCPICENSFQFI